MVVKSVAFSQNVREALATVVRQVLAEPLLYEVELVFSFKGVRRVEVPAERIASTRHEGRCPVSGRDSRSEAAMKLSEAILLGAMMKPQAVRALFNHDGACALGGALLAVGATGEPALGSVRNRWPGVFTVSADCPSCGRSGPVFGVITHLNDNHRWAREQIARWVTAIEPLDPIPEAAAGRGIRGASTLRLV